MVEHNSVGGFPGLWGRITSATFHCTGKYFSLITVLKSCVAMALPFHAGFLQQLASEKIISLSILWVLHYMVLGALYAL